MLNGIFFTNSQLLFEILRELSTHSSSFKIKFDRKNQNEFIIIFNQSD